jgi:hypothetical protein
MMPPCSAELPGHAEARLKFNERAAHFANNLAPHISLRWGRPDHSPWPARPRPSTPPSTALRFHAMNRSRSRRGRPPYPSGAALDPVDPATVLPDARDGLTRLERTILFELSRLEAERNGASVPTAMLYGRVVCHINVSVEEFQSVLSRLVGR